VKEMNLLFLDIDGVLACSRRAGSSGMSLGQKQLRLLKKLVASSQCGIVITSTWRLWPDSMEVLREAFEGHEIPLWCGITPNLRSSIRGDEILEWLRTNLTVPSVAVGIDDCQDISIGADHGLPVRYKPIATESDTGLTPGVVKEALAWFAGAE